MTVVPEPYYCNDNNILEPCTVCAKLTVYREYNGTPNMRPLCINCAFTAGYEIKPMEEKNDVRNRNHCRCNGWSNSDLNLGNV